MTEKFDKVSAFKVTEGDGKDGEGKCYTRVEIYRKEIGFGEDLLHSLY